LPRKNSRTALCDVVRSFSLDPLYRCASAASETTQTPFQFAHATLHRVRRKRLLAGLLTKAPARVRDYFTSREARFMNLARPAVREPALKIWIDRRRHSTVCRGCLSTHCTNLRIAPAGICVLRRISCDLNSHHFSPSRICCGCDIDLNRIYMLTERPFAPDSIPFSTVVVFGKIHFTMLHNAS
jgi:hypothetical protein